MRAKNIDGVIDEAIAAKVGLTGLQIEEMYQTMAIANYEDRFVIPTAHREWAEDALDLRGSCGFSFGNGCSEGETPSLFGGQQDAGDPASRMEVGLMRDFPHLFRASVLSDARILSRRSTKSARPSPASAWFRRASALASLDLVHDLRGHDLYELQERYVLLFDRTRSLSLHLFEHVHGESRDRGQAMVDLRALYGSKGLVGAENELPDFTPLFLEFLSTLDPAEALPLLGEPAHVFMALAERLHKRKSPYEAVFRALTAIAKAQPDESLLAILRAEPDPAPDDFEALDASL